MEILEIDGLKYSRKQFEGYKFRAKVEIGTVTDKHTLDIYTTDPNEESVENVLIDRRSDKVTTINIFHWATKEQDDAATKMIDEALIFLDNR